MAGDVTVRNLVTEWGFDVDNKPLKRFDKTISRLKTGVMALGTAAAAGASTLFGFASNAAKNARQIDQQAQSLGVAREEIQKYNHAFNKMGADSEDVSDAMGTVADRAQDVLAGAKGPAEDFGMIGLAAEDLRDKSPAELFDTVAEAMGKTEDSSKRVAASARIFGDDLARRLNPVLSGGADKLERLKEQAAQTGNVMSADAVRSGAALMKTFKELKAFASGFAQTLGSGAIPAAQQIASEILNFVKANRELINTNLRAFMESLGSATLATWSGIKTLAVGIENAVEALGGFEQIVDVAKFALMVFVGTAIYEAAAALPPLVAAIWAKVAAVDAAAIATWAWNTAVAALPIAIGAVLAIIGLLIEDIYRFSQGQQSLTGQLVKKYDTVAAVVYGVRDAWNATIKAAADAYVWITDKLFYVIPNMMKTWKSAITNWTSTTWDQITSTFESIWTKVKKTFFQFIQSITSKLSGFVGQVASIGEKVGIDTGLGDLQEKIEGFSNATVALEAQTGGAAADAETRALQTTNRAQYSFNSRFNIRQRPGESGEGLAKRIERKQREREQRERRQSDDFFSSGVQY